MRAIIIATGYWKELEPLVQHRPSPMLKIADKPILFHIIESLVPRGVTKIELFLSHYPLMIEKALDRGKRWGIPIEYHLAKDSGAPFKAIPHLSAAWKEEMLLFGQGDLLPELPDFSPEKYDHKTATLFNWPSKKWSGWGIVPGHLLGKLHVENEEQFEGSLTNPHKVIVRPYLSVRTFSDIKKSNLKVLEHKAEELIFPATSREVDAGVWISRGVALHPNVTIIPPVFIGDFCQILENASIGPNVVIEKHCLIDHSSKIENSVVCRYSYVGEGLLLQNSIVDRNLLINLSLNASIHIQDDFILSEIHSFNLFQKLLNTAKRGAALLLFTLLSPIYLYLRLTAAIEKKEALKLPSPPQKEMWKTYTLKAFKAKTRFQKFFQRLPQLINIIKGEMDFIGVSPRSPGEIEKLPSDWKKLYLSAKTGILTLARLDFGSDPSEEERYTCEAYYAVHMGFWFDLKLLLRWARQKWEKK